MLDYALSEYCLIYCLTIVLPAKTIPAVLASALPFRDAPVSNVIDCIAKMVPLNTEVVPKVAELPTCQKILAADAPPAKITFRPEVTVNEDAI